MKLTREALAHYLDASWKKDPTKAEWEIIGEDIEDGQTLCLCSWKCRHLDCAAGTMKK